jgi:hypothetical protein
MTICEARMLCDMFVDVIHGDLLRYVCGCDDFQ